jgi:DNA polymerase-3 subunit delta
LAELGVVAWGDGHKIVVLRDAELIPAAKMDELVSWIEQNPDSNSVTIFSNKVDKRLKYVKTLRQIGIEIDCQPIQGDQAVRYVLDLCTEQGKSMKRGTAELFLETVGTELLTIQNELEKLLALSGDREEITPDDIKSISCLAPGEIADRIIFQMTDFTANLDDVARQMGETNSYPLKKTKEHTKSYELQEIFRGFEAVLHADSELKLGVPGDQVLTDLIIKLT